MIFLFWRGDSRGLFCQSSSHVLPALACAMAGIYGCGILVSARLNMKTRHCISGCGGVKQPCHADVGLCDGGHLWLRHTGIRPPQYENPTLHIGV